MAVVYQQVDISTLIPAFSKVTNSNSIVDQSITGLFRRLTKYSSPTYGENIATSGVGLIII